MDRRTSDYIFSLSALSFPSLLSSPSFQDKQVCEHGQTDRTKTKTQMKKKTKNYHYDFGHHSFLRYIYIYTYTYDL